VDQTVRAVVQKWTGKCAGNGQSGPNSVCERVQPLVVCLENARFLAHQRATNPHTGEVVSLGVPPNSHPQIPIRHEVILLNRPTTHVMPASDQTGRRLSLGNGWRKLPVLSKRLIELMDGRQPQEAASIFGGAGVHQAFAATPSVSDARHTLALTNVRWVDPENVPVAAHKKAILRNETLARRLKGTWTLTDNATGQPLDQKDSIVAAVPMLTDNGTYVLNGIDNTLGFQSRLRAGPFVRRQENGDLHVHVNAMPGSGRSHHYQFDPEKGLFHLELGGSKVPLLPVLRAMGVNDKQLRQAWGDNIFGANAIARDGNAIHKLYPKLVRKPAAGATSEDQSKAVAAALTGTKLDAEVTAITLRHPHDHLTSKPILESTKRLLSGSATYGKFGLYITNAEGDAGTNRVGHSPPKTLETQTNPRIGSPFVSPFMG
jgi:hypothetical protein